MPKCPQCQKEMTLNPNNPSTMATWDCLACGLEDVWNYSCITCDILYIDNPDKEHWDDSYCPNCSLLCSHCGHSFLKLYNDNEFWKRLDNTKCTTCRTNPDMDKYFRNKGYLARKIRGVAK